MLFASAAGGSSGNGGNFLIPNGTFIVERVIFLVVLGIYFLLTLSYSFSLKAIVLVDTIVLAGLYTMRVIAGYAAADIVPTFWLLAFALFLFFGLAMLKRFSELIEVRERSDDGPPGRGYRADDLDVVEERVREAEKEGGGPRG